MKKADIRSMLIGFLSCACIFSEGCIVPHKLVIPVENATEQSWDHNSFWQYPWGGSVVHKGIDISAPKGTHVLSSTNGIVIFSDIRGKGGKVIYVFGPLLRLHYYAHLDSFRVNRFSYVRSGEIIGNVGTTGNAKGKDPHLHYSIQTPIPYIWRVFWRRNNPHHWYWKPFLLDPTPRLIDNP